MIDKTPPQPTNITMSESFYDDFCTAVLDTEGMPFDELAVVRPADAYKLLSGVIAEFAKGANSIKTGDGIEVSKEMDGPEAMSSFAYHAVKESTKDTDIQPVNVVVSVFQKPRFRDAIRGRESAPKQVLTFRVEPPSLA
jgi:hypothetical protein